MMDHENDIKQNNVYISTYICSYLKKFSQFHFLIIFSFYEIYLFSIFILRIVK